MLAAAGGLHWSPRRYDGGHPEDCGAGTVVILAPILVVSHQSDTQVPGMGGPALLDGEQNGI
jgi:hypothetical protein